MVALQDFVVLSLHVTNHLRTLVLVPRFLLTAKIYLSLHGHAISNTGRICGVPKTAREPFVLGSVAAPLEQSISLRWDMAYCTECSRSMSQLSQRTPGSQNLRWPPHNAPFSHIVRHAEFDRCWPNSRNIYLHGSFRKIWPITSHLPRSFKVIECYPYRSGTYDFILVIDLS